MSPRQKVTVTTCALIIAVFLSSAAAWAQGGFPESANRNDIVPGRFFVDPPTLENLGFRWYVDGDKNRNATVEVAYRVKGDEEWREAQPMLRVRHEVVDRGFRTGNLFAGSVLLLEPTTEYEVMFTMKDPDGGAPEDPKVVTVATGSEAQAWAGGKTIAVQPGESILAAYEKAAPGDIIMLEAGVHAATEAPYVLKTSGEPGKPIVFRGVGADKTIIQGPNHATDLFCLADVHDIVFEDLTLRRWSAAIHTALNHLDNMANHFVIDPGFAGPGASNITVRRCKIEDVANGIWTCSKNSSNWTISDNVIIGANKRWYPFNAHEEAISFIGVNLYGQGHVVCYNKINSFLLLLCTADAGDPDPNDLETFPVNIDFYNNELFYGIGDTIQTDYTAHNVRVYRNLCSNARCGISVQPSFGGPIYLIRNEIYGIYEHFFKWNNRPAGILAYHNTNGSSFYTTPHQNCHLRNNLFFGGSNSTTLTPELHTMDYDGFGGRILTWAHGDVPKISHTSLEKFTAATGFEKHGIMISRDDFVNAAEYQPGRSWKPEDFDLRLKEGSKAIDSAVRLPNINDHYNGEAPDRGAIEFGDPPPHYGPREKQ